MFRRNLPVFAIVLMQVAAAAARADEADEYIKGEMQKQRIPGLSAAVVRRGEVIKAKGYGLASVELNVAASPETVYKIGSISKQFLATGIMLLAGEGRLGLKDPISKYLDGTPGSWKDITIWHLLTHTSGLAREAPGFNPLKIQSDAEVIKTAYPLPLHFQPGEKWEYCNLGYFTLAEIIRKVSGKAWSEFLDERVFRPLGMNATRTTSMKDIILNRADAYFWEGNKLLNAEDLIALRPSGAFVSTVRDLAKWDAALYGDTILTASARERMWQPAAQTDRKSDDGTNYSYGFGWQIALVNGHKEVSHGGTLAGFRAALVRFVDDKLTVVVLTNVGNASPDTIARGVAALYIPGLASKGSGIK